MKYPRKCLRCGRRFIALRPQGRYCQDACRVGSYNQRKRKASTIAKLNQQIRTNQQAIIEQRTQIVQQEKEMQRCEKLFNHYTHLLHDRVRSFRNTWQSFYQRYQNRRDLVTGKRVPPYSEGTTPDSIEAIFIYRDRQEKMPKAAQEWRRERRHVHQHGQQYQKQQTDAKAQLAQLEVLAKKHQRELLKLQRKNSNAAQQSREKDNSSSSLTEGIGAADFLKLKIKTFQLKGKLGEFLGELEQQMLAIALVGDPGAGKSTMVVALTQLFHLAGFSVIFYSLELGKSKPLQDMIRRYPLGNQVRIEEIGTIEDVRATAENYDVVIVDSFGKLGCKAEAWDQLRQGFPSTIFLSIFQKTTSGGTRGGASVDYDASMVINMVKEKETGKRVAIMRKSRYGTQGWKYYPEEDIVVRV